jgi:hypothetical protein
LHQHEALGIRDNLGGVQRLLQILKELLLVALKLVGATNELEDLGGTRTLALEGGQATGENSFGNQSDWHAKVQRVDSSPLSGTLLSSRVEDLLEERSSIVIVEVQDVTSNFDQEGIEDTLVPLGKGVADLLVLHSETALHDIVGLRDIS